MKELHDQATVIAASFSEIPTQLGPSDSSPIKQVAEITTARAIQAFMLSEAKARAETAELQKRLVMQQFRPCNLYPTVVYNDGLRWVCVHVSSRQFEEYEGTDAVAYGMSPEEAMVNFDAQWLNSMEDDNDLEKDDEDEEGENF